MFSRLSLFLGALVVCATVSLAAPTSAQTARTLVLAADDAGGATNVVGTLMGTGRFAVVDLYNVSSNPASSNPDLATLQTYDSVIIYTNYTYNDAAALGSLLHAYVNSGGLVVEMAFSVAGYSPLSGDWAANNDSAIEPTTYDYGVSGALGTVAQPLHPIMAGVSSLTGGARGHGALRVGSDLVASWSNGDVLAATRTVGTGTVVALNFFPVSTAYNLAAGWSPTTDGALLMANALTLEAAAAPAQVPTLSEWAMVLFGALLAGSAALYIQRRRQYA